MSDTMERLLKFHGPESKVIVWEHNTHIGDARATDMVNEGMFNIGELARMHHHDKGVMLVGFGSYKGTVMAGKSWNARMQIMPMPEAKKGSWEYLTANKEIRVNILSNTETYTIEDITETSATLKTATNDYLELTKV